MRALLQDVGYFGRSVVKSPGFFAVAVLTLALGIGANTAIFSVINAVLLRPLPFDEPDRLVRLFETEAAPGNYPWTGPDYLDLQAQNRTLEATSLFAWYRRLNVSGSGQPETALGMRTEANFFGVLGVRPLLGRTFTRGESASGGAKVAVLSYGFWQRHFGGDPACRGQAGRARLRALHGRRRHARLVQLSEGHRGLDAARHVGEEPRVPRIAQLPGRRAPQARREQRPGAGGPDDDRHPAREAVPEQQREDRRGDGPDEGAAHARPRASRCSSCSAPSRSCCSSPARTSPTCC